MNVHPLLSRTALTLGAVTLAAPLGLSQANDFLGTSVLDATDWLTAGNWSKGVVPGAPYVGAADFCRMTTTDAVLSGPWYDSPSFSLSTESGFGYNTNVAVGFQTTNKLTITGAGFLHSAHAGGIAVGKKAGGNGTVEVQAGGYLVSTGAGGILLGANDASATGRVEVHGTVRTQLLTLAGSVSTFEIKSGGKLQDPFPLSGWPELSIDGGGTFRTESNVSLSNTDLVNGWIDVPSGNQVWFRNTCDISPTGLYTGVGGGKVLFDGTTTIDGTFSNDGPLDVRAGTSLTLGAAALATGPQTTVWLRNDTELKFLVDAAGGHATLAGGPAGYDVRFGTTPSLVVEFAAPPVTGTSLVLMSGVNDFKNWDGSQSGFTFGSETVTGLAAGQTYTLDYDLPGQQLVLNVVQDLFTDLGLGTAGISGVPVLDAVGDLTPGALLGLELTGAAPGAPGFLIGGFSQVDLLLFGATLVPAPDVVLPVATDGNGEVSFSTTFPLPGTPAGVSLYAQCWVFDTAGPQGFAASNALLGVTR